MQESENRKRTRGIGEQGFTVIELLIVITIIAILAGLVLPKMLTTIGESNKSVCSLYKSYILRNYGFFKTVEEDYTLQDALNDSKLFCPQYGIYYIDDGREEVRCTYHDDGIEPLITPPIETPEPTDNTPRPSDGTELQPTGDWAEQLALAVASSGGIVIDTSEGNVFEDSSGMFVLDSNVYLPRNEARNNVTIAEFAASRTWGVVRVDSSKALLTEDDYGEGRWTGETPTYGRLAEFDGETYIYRNKSGGIWASRPPGSGWLLVINEP